MQEKQPNNGNMKALWKTYNASKKENGYGIPPAIWIDWVELEGPHPVSPRTWKQRREVEEHANAKVGGTYNGYFKRRSSKRQKPFSKPESLRRASWTNRRPSFAYGRLKNTARASGATSMIR